MAAGEVPTDALPGTTDGFLYLLQHNVQPTIHQAIAQVLKDRPADPVAALSTILRAAGLDAGRYKRQPVPMDVVAMTFEFWWSDTGETLQRVELLKAIEKATAEVYEKHVLGKVEDEALRQQLRAVSLESNLAGLEEFGPEWYACIQSKMVRMELCTEFVSRALDVAGDGCGFDAFERALVAGSARALPFYNQYYLDYLHAVQAEDVCAALAAQPPPTDRADLYSSYTVVRLNEQTKQLSAVPFATHFGACLAPLLASFDGWISACTAAIDAPIAEASPWTADARAAYVRFLQQCAPLTTRGRRLPRPPPPSAAHRHRLSTASVPSSAGPPSHGELLSLRPQPQVPRLSRPERRP